MSAYLPLIAQQLFNTPLAMHESMAEVIVSALAGKLNIAELVTSSAHLDRQALAARAAVQERSPTGKAPIPRRKPSSAGITPSSHAMDMGDSFLRLNNVAVIPVYGTLTKSGGLCTSGYNDFTKAHLDAIDDDTIAAIWYDINSGGGGVAGCFGWTDMIAATNEKAGGKPVWAMAADTSYSAAFAPFAAADMRFVPDTGGVGSVGCLTMVADASKALENEGIEIQVIRSTSQKALLSGVEPIKGNPAMEAAVEKLTAQVKQAGDIFTDRVAQYLDVTKKAVAETQGSDYMGADAKVIGFVDDVMSEAQAFALLTRYLA